MFTVNYADARQERARDKARAERPVVEVEALGAYRVEGSAGNFYNVTVALAGGAFEVGCSCIAGQNDKPGGVSTF